MSLDPVPDTRLDRRLGLLDAVVIGLGSMIGAGVFAAFGPAAAAAGGGLLAGLAVAAVVAYCNATSSARLAALYPESGGAYVYGRRRLGDAWGHLAGWAFVAGKLASCAAIALTFGTYAWPRHPRPAAVAAVVALTAVNYRGVRKSARLTRVLVAVTLLALAAVVASGASAGVSSFDASAEGGVRGVLRAAGLLFFAFAGYARVATLGEEVRDPARTIPRAIGIALGITFAVYAAVAASALYAAGPDALARAASPLVTATEAGGLASLTPLVRVGAAVATLGTLLALVLGVSRTAFAMAADGYLPRPLAAVHATYKVPHRAEIAAGAVVAVLVATVDLRDAIGFSSFGVLAYYGVANTAALTLTTAERRPPRWVPLLGLAGCAVLALSLPLSSVLAGAAVLVVGVAVRLAQS